MTDQRKEPTLSTLEICQKADVSRNTLYKWAANGFIRPAAKRTVHSYRWSEENLEDILDYCKRRISR